MKLVRIIIISPSHYILDPCEGRCPSISFMGFEFEQGKFIVTHDIARVSVTIVLRIVNYMTLYTTSYCEYYRVEYKYYNLYNH